MMPVCVISALAPRIRAMPKSMILIAATSPPERYRLPGLRSRWTKPERCIAPSAPATVRPSSTVSLMVSSRRASRSRSVSPASHSIARNASPAPVVPCATYRTMPGCESSESTRASRANRSAMPIMSAAWSTLSATVPPACPSRAR
jgi:hypothetical protein